MIPSDDDLVPELELSTPLTRARELASSRARDLALRVGAHPAKIVPASAATQRASRLGIRSGLANRAARLGLTTTAAPLTDGDQEKSA